MKTGTWFFLFSGLICSHVLAQDSTELPPKIRHAEPLYVDLIRDLGARKGEREWNAAWNTETHGKYTAHTGLFEYEWSPMHRLGLEVEVPFTLYRFSQKEDKVPESPRNRIEGIKMAAQYSFLVSKNHQLTLAAGYIHQVRLHSFYTIGNERTILKGHVVNPFVIVAKRWGRQFHSMLYTGPAWETTTHISSTFAWQANTSVHYMLPEKHFVGLEVNGEFSQQGTVAIARPQIKLVMNSNVALGLVTGIPLHAPGHGMSFMVRMIYEPRR